MAEKDENYVGVAMGLDVTDLKAGLSEANKQIQLANSEFKAASSGMDDWTKSTEGITAKVKQLDTVLKMQQAKLKGLTAEYEKVVEEQGESSEAARKLQIQINNQQAVVNKTEKEFNNYRETLEQAEAGTLDLENVTLKAGKAVVKAGKDIKSAAANVEEIGESAEKATKDLDDMSDSAEEAGGKVKGGFGKSVAVGIAGGIAAIGAAAVAAVGSFLSLAESTREARENFNKLETGFTTAGHSAEDAQKTYKELYGILGDEGQATEAAAHLAQLTSTQEELAQWTDIATGVYATFGASLPIENLTEAANETAKTGKLTGGLADALNWAGVNEEEFQAQLDAATSEQERQALITSTLNGLYSEQSEKFKELNGDIIAAREADAALTQTMAELGAIAEPIMTTLKLLAVDLLNSIKPFVELIGTGLKGALEGSANAGATLAEGLGGILNVIVEKMTQMLPTVLNLILQLVPQIANTLLSAAPQLLTVITNLAVQVINMLSTLLPQILQKIVEILPLLINSLISAIPQLLQAATTLLLAIVQAIPILVENLVAALPSVIKTIIQALIQSIPILLQAAIQLLNALVRAIPVIIQALTQNLPLIIDTILSGVLDALPLLLDAAITLFFAIIDAIPVIVAELMRAFPQIIEAILKSLVKATPKLFSTAKTLLDKIIDAVGELIRKLPSKMGEVITAIVSGLTKGFSKITEVGGDLIEGLWNGIKDMTGWITDKLESFGESVLGGIKNFFGIESPSKLMRDEVGKYIGEGVGVGILDSIPSVRKQLSKFSNFIGDNIGDIKSGLSFGAAGTGGSTGTGTGARSVVVNAGMSINYNGNLSLKEIKQREREHYVSLKTKLKAEGLI